MLATLEVANNEVIELNQWRIKGGADWATARGPQSLSR